MRALLSEQGMKHLALLEGHSRHAHALGVIVSEARVRTCHAPVVVRDLVPGDSREPAPKLLFVRWDARRGQRLRKHGLCDVLDLLRRHPSAEKCGETPPQILPAECL